MTLYYYPHTSRAVSETSSQLGGLLFGSKQVSLFRGSKAALRAQRKSFHRHIPARLFNALFQFVLAFELWLFGCDQS